MLTQLVSAGLITGLAAGGYAYAANWPTSQIFGRTVLAGSDVRQVALTFDDGPNDPYTLRLIELLARHEVRATFFVIGGFVRRHPEIVRGLHQAGHLVGNHTMSHPSLLWERPVRVREELSACNAAIEDATGEAVHWFRPLWGTPSGCAPRCGGTWAHACDVECDRARLGCQTIALFGCAGAKRHSPQPAPAQSKQHPAARRGPQAARYRPLRHFGSHRDAARFMGRGHVTDGHRGRLELVGKEGHT
jgi:peptidoglycan/xylan/chitin deacetylase (PgdA/CDA1 family)